MSDTPTTKASTLDALGRFTWGAVVAIVALLILGAVFAILVFAKAPDLAASFGAIATPVVAIASAYFGIQIAGKAANTAGDSAVAASKAAVSAQTAAHEATGVAKEASRKADTAMASNVELRAANDALTERVRAQTNVAPVTAPRTTSRPATRAAAKTPPK